MDSYALIFIVVFLLIFSCIQAILIHVLFDHLYFFEQAFAHIEKECYEEFVGSVMKENDSDQH